MIEGVYQSESLTLLIYTGKAITILPFPTHPQLTTTPILITTVEGLLEQSMVTYIPETKSASCSEPGPQQQETDRSGAMLPPSPTHTPLHTSTYMHTYVSLSLPCMARRNCRRSTYELSPIRSRSRIPLRSEAGQETKSAVHNYTHSNRHPT